MSNPLFRAFGGNQQPIDSNIITQNINEDGTVTYKGITDYGDFIMIQDSETGLWKEFKIENIPLCVIFSDYKTN